MKLPVCTAFFPCFTDKDKGDISILKSEIYPLHEPSYFKGAIIFS
jgi:hypothetical protein